MLKKLLTKGATYIFPGGRLLKLVHDGVKISNSTSPLMVTKNITMTVLDCCAPPPVKIASNCIAATALIISSAISPNPITIGSAIHIISTQRQVKGSVTKINEV